MTMASVGRSLVAGAKGSGTGGGKGGGGGTGAVDGVAGAGGEEEELKRLDDALLRVMPTTIDGFKRHPLYTLHRHAKRLV